MKIISASLNLSLIDKSRIVTLDKDGNPFKNGAKYLNIDIIVNDEKNQYGQDTSISHSQSKQEREAKEKKIYLGNGKTVWENAPQVKHSSEPALSQNKPVATKSDDQLPF